jgi:hypothetical protein
MRRRECVSLLGGIAIAWPLGAGAQQLAMPVIGFLQEGDVSAAPHLLAAFRQGLAEAEYVEGKNLAIEYRFSKDRPHFPNDDAAMKLLYLVLNNAADEWKRPPREWFEAKTQFAVVFGERFVGQ